MGFVLLPMAYFDIFKLCFDSVLVNSLLVSFSVANYLILTNLETCISQAFDAIASSSGGIQIKDDTDHSS